MSAKVRHVDATCGGESVRFELPTPTPIVGPMQPALREPFATYKRFGSGDWSGSDIFQVLSEAHPKRIAALPVIAETITAKPAATYAGLAVKILEAHLFGIDADRAHFDEAHAFADAGN